MTMRDTTSAAFEYAFVIPSAAIPPEGLLLEVLDDDAEPGPEAIGSARLSAATLSAVLSAPGGTTDLHNGSVTQLELVVTPYEPTRIPALSMPASSPPRIVAARPLEAGETVSLRASGSYTVGSWYREKIGPGGYRDADPQRFNFKQPPFATAPHACAIALIGDANSIEGAVVGTSSSFMALVAGPLRVGVNDVDPANNIGSLSFEGETRAPTADEWLTARQW
jgi:hypothetical protein